MILVTTNEIPGKSVVRTLGLVRGNSVRGRHIGLDLIAHLRNAVGGEITEYTKMMAEAREQAIDRMCEEARLVGANAILGVRFSTNSSTPGASEILTYGTAVIIDDDAAPED